MIALVFYVISGMGISMGFHRYFTHSSFKANRGLKIALAVAGSLAIEGVLLVWVAGPPPARKYTRQGRRPALAVAVRHRLEGTDQGLRLRAHRLAVQPEPDVAGQVLPGPAGGQGRQPRLAVVPGLVAVSLLAPALIGGLWSMSIAGALTAFFWASLVGSACCTT